MNVCQVHGSRGPTGQEQGGAGRAGLGSREVTLQDGDATTASSPGNASCWWELPGSPPGHGEWRSRQSSCLVWWFWEDGQQ